MLSSNSGVSDVVRSVSKWDGILGQLLSGEMPQQELSATVDRSGRTIRRAVRELEDLDLIELEDGTVALTQFGRQIASIRCEYIQKMQSVNNAKELLVRLPGSISIPCGMMDGARTETFPDPLPDAAFNAIERSMHGADRVRGISPIARNRYVEAFSEHIFEFETEVELILEYETIDGLDEYYADAWRDALSEENCTIRPTESVPAFGLILVDESDVWLGVYRDGGGLMGTIHNDSEAAVMWAIELFERYRAQADGPL